MKTTLTKTLLSASIFALLGFGQANASTEISCIGNHKEIEFSVYLPENANSGDAWLVFSDGQQFKGTFKSGTVNGNTRLTGATALSINANTMLISTVGFDGNLNGHAQFKNQNGQVIEQIFISCKTQQ